LASSQTSSPAQPAPPADAGAAHAGSDFRPDIQGLRALAVVLVVCAHAGVPHLAGGYVGVDVFFVISGFVITCLLRRQPSRTVGQNLAHFYARRIRRIVPAATVVLVVTVVATYHWLGPSVGRPLVTDVRWASLFAANWHLIATNASYFIPGVPPSLVTHFWSLAVEEQFYLGYPLVVFTLGVIFVPRHRTAALAVVLAVAVVVSSWWSIRQTGTDAVAAYYSPFTRFWELALGGLVALAPASLARRTPRLNALLALGALAALALAVWRLNDHSAYPGSLAWWPCAAAAVLLWSGSASSRLAPAWWLSRRPVRYVGDVSYGFYLWHYAWLMLPAQYATTPMSATSRALQVAGAFGCAVVSYHLLEDPIRRSKWLDGDNLAAFMILVICLLVTWNVTLLYVR
jgi:peptidoglycan/LPS O-acetylase OafA/YrhL